MKNNFSTHHFFSILLLCLFVAYSGLVNAQTTSEERLKQIDERLRTVSVTVPGLTQKVQLSMSGATAQEFLRALAQANNLNINVDPQLNFKVYNNFRNETAMNILLFLSKEYDLDINIIGSIMSVTKAVSPRVVIPPKEIRVTYNPANDNLGFELNGDSLSLVAKKISQLSQKNVVVPVNLLAKKVTAFIAAAPFETALEKMAYANELKLNKTNDNVFIFQPLGDGEELYISGDNATSVKRNNKPTATGSGAAQGGNFNLSGKRDAGGQKLVSVDALNTPILDLIKSASTEAGVNYFIYSDIKGTVTTHLTNITYDSFLTALLQGTEYTFKKDAGIYLLGERKLEGLRTTRILQLQHRSIDTVVVMIPTEWKRGVEIKEFREQNTLLMSGSAPQINEIENYIKQIDKVVPMILIEVTLVDVRKSKTISTGISAGVSDTLRRTGGTVFPGLNYTFGAKSINSFLSSIGSNNSVNLGRVTPNFYVSLKALEANSNVEIRSVPKLSTLNGHKANLSIGSSRYYSQSTQNVIPSLNAQTVVTQQFTEVNANLEIEIRPIVSGDDQVTLNIGVNISDFIGNPPLNAPPPKSTSKFTSIIRAKNEDMIVLGGLERTENSESGSGVPILSRIPILKWLFSSREKTNAKVVTLVFIKPTIMY